MGEHLHGACLPSGHKPGLWLHVQRRRRRRRRATGVPPWTSPCWGHPRAVVWRPQPPLGPGCPLSLCVPSPGHPTNAPARPSPASLGIGPRRDVVFRGRQEVMVGCRGARDGPEVGWRWLPKERRAAEARRRLPTGTIKARQGQTRSEVAEVGSSGPGRCGSCGAQQQEDCGKGTLCASRAVP